MAGKTEQTFSFEIVSCLLAALGESGTVVGSRHYKLMAQVDGSRTASGYEHLFRAVKARAKEINGQIACGQIEASAHPPRRQGLPGAARQQADGSEVNPAFSTRKERFSVLIAAGRKAAAENESLVDEENDEEEKISPSKKVKAENLEDSDDRL